MNAHDSTFGTLGFKTGSGTVRCCYTPIHFLAAFSRKVLTGTTDQTTSTVCLKVTEALRLITGTGWGAAVLAGVGRVAVQLTRGVALPTPGAEGGVGHLALQPGAVVADAGILVKLAALLQCK